ncbi:neurexin-1 isoform X2 [Trichogramma pretiosum]|uniref:neurexin-1 isoform X2 n=1 Tax=Trichogramma pretiosum TaxID=7493 RepID=UPI000C718C92|nr:neurexin-1 isoform X2 [Trichogramma pretiosum]
MRPTTMIGGSRPCCRRTRAAATGSGLLLLSLQLLLLLPLVSAFYLDGSAGSHARFSRWNAAPNASLELEFKTEQGQGLLLYADDGGLYDFFEAKLVEGALRLRYNLGDGAQSLSLGRDLGDGRWHRLRLARAHHNTSVSLDGRLEASSVSRGPDVQFGRTHANSDLFLGGLPAFYSSKLTLLALPSVIFEPRFKGFIRNLVYADGDNVVPRRQEIQNPDPKCGGLPCPDNNISRKMARSLRGMVQANSSDVCETRDPCQHGGICISTDSGPFCECRSAEYEGMYCEKDKASSEASFRGTEYLTIDLSKGKPVLSSQEGIFLQFKTKQPNGLLFYSGHGQDYMTISLRDGGVAVGMTLANGRLDMHIKPTRIRFDDNQWHKVMVHRKVQEISSVTRFCRLTASVDGIYTEQGHTAGAFTRLASERLLVGGGADARELAGSKGINNFVGCMRKVEFQAEGVRMELVEAARSGTVGAAAWGKIEFQCRDPRTSDPVTFTTGDSHLGPATVTMKRLHGTVVTFTSPESHLVLPPWKGAKSGSISFKIRTNEPNGLVMYSRSGAITRTDLFAFEILGGYLYLHMDLGEGALKVRASEKRVDDGTWHEVALRRVEREGRVVVDDSTIEFRPPGDATQLDLDGLLFIGGVGAPFAPLTVPPVLWTGSLRQGYVGCMRDLVINGQPIDIAGYAQQQDSGAVRPACHVQGPHCNSQPCMHSGKCIEGWNRFHCDCSATAYTGATCGKDASTLYLNGSQQMTALMPEDSKTQAEELVIRFKTTKPRGLLLATSLENSVDRLQISLDEGAARALIHIDHQEKEVVAGQGLNDDMWHTLKFSRRGNSVKFQIDDEEPVKAEAMLGEKNTLEFRTLHVGGYLHSSEEIPRFVGQLQQLWFNGYPYLEIARSAGTHQTAHQGLTPIIRINGKFGKRNHPVHHPVTFTSKHTFVGLPMLKAYVETNIYFQFKTREANGLILYNSGRERDFIAVELVNGHIHYVFDLGDGPVRLRDSTKSRLNDGKWHAVTIARPAPKRHTLAVDDHVVVANSPGSNENLDLDGILFIGGTEKAQYSILPKPIQSRHGFEGCLASLDLSGESPDLISDAVVPSSLVESGCDAYANLHPGKKCNHDMCANHGTCVQQWNSFTCDCDMTSFSGPTCTDESPSYEFGAGRGVITYTFPPDRRPEMKRDTLAMGFITSVNDAILLRIESASSNDYLEIEIVEGNVFAVYNMGTSDHPIGEVGVKVNDNQYHVLRFTRSGANSTLQIDDYNLQSNHPQGNQHAVFNSQSTIQIGGRWNRGKNKIDKTFMGIISGLIVNGARIFELAAAKDNRVSIKGDVQLLPLGSLVDRAAPLQRMQQTPASGSPGVADDLIFSGAGSGCAGDDEDEDCTPIYENGSDDLITPVYVASTKSTVTVRPKIHAPSSNMQEKNIQCDDEEECNEEGSGDSGNSEDIFVPSSTARSSPTSGYNTTPRYAVQSSSPGLAIGTTQGSSSHRVEPHTTQATQHGYSVTSDSIPSSATERSTTTTTSTTPSTTTTTTTTSTTPSTTTTTSYYTIEHRTTTYRIPSYTVILPPKTTSNNNNNNNNKRITSETAENAALIIGIIAGALIAIVLIILIILKFKGRPEANYKIDDSKGFCQEPNAALLGAAGGGSAQMAGAGGGQSYNGSVKNGQAASKNGKGRQLKDIKEWYV